MSKRQTPFMQAAIRANQGKIPAHLRCATSLTAYGYRDMSNKKPFRTTFNRLHAKAAHLKAERGEITHDEVRMVPVAYHGRSNDKSVTC